MAERNWAKAFEVAVLQDNIQRDAAKNAAYFESVQADIRNAGSDIRGSVDLPSSQSTSAGGSESDWGIVFWVVGILLLISAFLTMLLS